MAIFSNTNRVKFPFCQVWLSDSWCWIGHAKRHCLRGSELDWGYPRNPTEKI